MAQAQTRHYAFDAFDLDNMEKGGYTEFADRAMRVGFMKKVFGLLGLQLALTTVIGASCVLHSGVRGFLLANPVIPMMAILATFAIIILFSVSETARQRHPHNLVLLFTFTACEGLLVGLASSAYKTDMVVLAFAITAAVSSGLAIYAQRTKHDFTTKGGCLFAMLMSFMVSVLLFSVFRTPMIELAISLVGAALFSMYLVYDIQMLMGGQHQHKISPDDYVMASIAIYLDIINIFLYILRILGSRRD